MSQFDECIGFVGDAGISTSEEGTLESPRKLVIMSFTDVINPYDFPEDIVVDRVYVFRNGNIQIYNITQTEVSIIGGKFAIEVNDGTNFVNLDQNVATEFSLIPHSDDISALFEQEEDIYIRGDLITNFNIAQYEGLSCYLFMEGENTYGFGIMMNEDQTSYSIHSFTNVEFNDTSQQVEGSIDGLSFTSDFGEYFPGLTGYMLMTQFDSMSGFEDWFRISGNSWFFAIIIFLIIVIAIIVAGYYIAKYYKKMK